MQVGRIITKTPWYADMVNYLVCGIIPIDFTYQQKKKFLHESNFFFWDEPLLFKECADGIMRRCIPQEETHSIIYHCHTRPCGGHVGVSKTQAKVLQAGFFWPSMFKDVYAYIQKCDPCQRSGKITKRNEMPQKGILEVELFDVWGLDFIGPLPSSQGYKHILVAVDYVSKWVEVVPTVNADAKAVCKMFKTMIFP